MENGDCPHSLPDSLPDSLPSLISLSDNESPQGTPRASGGPSVVIQPDVIVTNPDSDIAVIGPEATVDDPERPEVGPIPTYREPVVTAPGSADPELVVTVPETAEVDPEPDVVTSESTLASPRDRRRQPSGLPAPASATTAVRASSESSETRQTIPVCQMLYNMRPCLYLCMVGVLAATLIAATIVVPLCIVYWVRSYPQREEAVLLIENGQPAYPGISKEWNRSSVHEYLQRLPEYNESEVIMPAVLVLTSRSHPSRLCNFQYQPAAQSLCATPYQSYYYPKTPWHVLQRVPTGTMGPQAPLYIYIQPVSYTHLTLPTKA